MLIICTLTTTIFQLFLCERHFSNLYLVICYAIKIVYSFFSEAKQPKSRMAVSGCRYPFVNATWHGSWNSSSHRRSLTLKYKHKKLTFNWLWSWTDFFKWAYVLVYPPPPLPPLLTLAPQENQRAESSKWSFFETRSFFETLRDAVNKAKRKTKGQCLHGWPVMRENRLSWKARTFLFLAPLKKVYFLRDPDRH